MAVSSSWTRWQDWGNVLAGGWLVVAPFVLGTSDEAPSTWTAVTMGVLVALVAVWALGQPRSAGAEWTNVTLGAVLVLAPWALGFASVAAAAWNAWIVGATVLALAGWAVPATRGSRLDTSPRHESIG
jgi:hypothetical protein